MWNDLSVEYDERGGSYFNDVMRRIARERPEFMPPLQNAQELVVVSDFAGDHVNSRLVTLSFLILSSETAIIWAAQRAAVRKSFSLHSRRFAYSKLTDRRKRAAMPSFCAAVNQIDGLSVTIAVDRRIESMFRPHGYFDPAEVAIAGKSFSRWKPAVLERAFRAAYFAAFFVGGLSSPNQAVTWITDEDAIASNETTMRDLVRILTYFVGQMSVRNPQSIRVGTTANFRTGDLLAEDLAAIPDLVAGSVNELLGSYGDKVPLFDVIALAPRHLSKKAEALINRLFDPSASLRKLIFTVEAIPGTSKRQFGCPTIELTPTLIQTVG
jgi:hypothetical protein